LALNVPASASTAMIGRLTVSPSLLVWLPGVAKAGGVVSSTVQVKGVLAVMLASSASAALTVTASVRAARESMGPGRTPVVGLMLSRRGSRTGVKLVVSGSGLVIAGRLTVSPSMLL